MTPVAGPRMTQKFVFIRYKRPTNNSELTYKNPGSADFHIPDWVTPNSQFSILWRCQCEPKFFFKRKYLVRGIAVEIEIKWAELRGGPKMNIQWCQSELTLGKLLLFS